MRPFLALLLCQSVILGAPAQSVDGLRRPAGALYDVVVLRVEFQPDDTRFTTGDGTFGGDLFGGLEPTIDPLPHDAAYFEAHLQFLRNYVEHVSDGRTRVRTHLLPDVVRLSGQMGSYAPIGMDANAPGQLARMARMIEEAWTLANDRFTLHEGSLDPERTAFMIFHAGVGRDVELTGTTLDRTPEDLPSLFFSPSMLRDLLPNGSIQFGGLDVDHTIVLPRTESRLGTDFIRDEPFLAEISMNGMMAASFFNFLGVPDLFDTNSGQSAIGPYGLMDPLGIFAYAGLFPPEPSAWTRYFLGWADPIDVSGPDSLEVVLRSSSLAGTSDLARVWVSEREYFLVENRHRDPLGEGLRLQVWNEGIVEEISFDHGAPGFSGFNVSAFPGGVVVGANNYDWALPGGLDEEGTELVGGILIWHIDERVIADGLPSNTINANPRRRGIDLEEADSAEDLGYPSENPFAPQADLGSPFDFWYRGNPVRVVNAIGQEMALYRNRFGPDTYPNSNSADGGPSFVVIEDFSLPAAEMSFVYRRADASSVRLLDSERVTAIAEVLDQHGFSPEAFAVTELADALVADVRVNDEAWLVVVATDGVEAFEALTPSVRIGDAIAWIDEAIGGGLQVVIHDPRLAEQHRVVLPGSEGAVPIGPAMAVAEAAGTNTLRVLAHSSTGSSVYVISGDEVEVSDVSDLGGPVGMVASGGIPFVFGRSGAEFVGTGAVWSYETAEDALGLPAYGRDVIGTFGVLPIPDRRQLLVLETDRSARRVGLDVTSSHLALADVDGDGQLEIIVAGDSLIHAYARSGARANGFPISLSSTVSGAPAVAVDRAGETYLFVPLTSGAVEGFVSLGGGRRGFRRLEGFPLAAGAAPVDLSIGTGVDGGGSLRLYAATETGGIYAWEVDGGLSTVWSGRFGSDARGRVVVVRPPDEPQPGGSARLLVKEDTYNWPNPVREGRTYLRCRTTEDSTVRVTIIDSAGSLVDELDLGFVRADVPTEMLWETNASSGLYFARVTARSASGREDTRLVKLAVIR